VGSNISNTRCRVLPDFPKTQKRLKNTSRTEVFLKKKTYTPEVVGVNFNGIVKDD